MNDFIPARQVSRQWPENLAPGDEPLFLHEISRGLPEASAVKIRDARIFGKNLYSGVLRRPRAEISYPWKTKTPNTSPKAFARVFMQTMNRQTVRSKKALYIVDNWSANYYHWVAESLPRLLALRKLGFHAPVIVPFHLSKINFIAESLQLLGIECLITPPGAVHHVTELRALPYLSPTGNPDPSLILSLRSMFLVSQERPPPAGFPTKTRFWISRGNARSRHIANENELMPILESYDFEVICPEKFSFTDQVSIFSRAAIIAGPHGAGLTNLIFAKSGARLLEIRKKGDARNNCYFALANALEMPYWYCSASMPSSPESDEPLHLDPAEFDRALRAITAQTNVVGPALH